MSLQLLDPFVRQRLGMAGDAECAVAGVTPGAAGDLRHLGRRQAAMLEAVELVVLREGDVVDIEIQPHADGVGRDKVIDVAGLVELDLRVARARRERAQDDGRSPPLAADQLGDGIDLVGREGDDGRAARQAGDLLGPDILQHRHARSRDDRDARQQRLERGADGGRAEQHGLVAAAQVADAVGEDVAALQVRGQLHLVDGDEGGVDARRHRLHGADTVLRVLRDDALLARDERDVLLAHLLLDAAVDLAREQAQRQADDSGRMRHHPLDRQMRLARVGRTQNGGHAAPRQPLHALIDRLRRVAKRRIGVAVHGARGVRGKAARNPCHSGRDGSRGRKC